jgi:hypothetical protein
MCKANPAAAQARLGVGKRQREALAERSGAALAEVAQLRAEATALVQRMQVGPSFQGGQPRMHAACMRRFGMRATPVQSTCGCPERLRPWSCAHGACMPLRQHADLGLVPRDVAAGLQAAAPDLREGMRRPEFC